jgi:hypothetical protein
MTPPLIRERGTDLLDLKPFRTFLASCYLSLGDLLLLDSGCVDVHSIRHFESSEVVGEEYRGRRSLRIAVVTKQDECDLEQ